MIAQILLQREVIEQKLQYYNALCQEEFELQMNLLVCQKSKQYSEIEKSNEYKQTKIQEEIVPQSMEDLENRATLISSTNPNGREIKDMQFREDTGLLRIFLHQGKFQIQLEYNVEDMCIQGMKIKSNSDDFELVLLKGSKLQNNELEGLVSISEILLNEKEVFSDLFSQFLKTLQ